MQTSNWTKAATGERYGAGEVYAFDDRKDAYKWAAKMDWDFNGDMGTGKICIIHFRNNDTWERDEMSPLEKAGMSGNQYKKYTSGMQFRKV